MGHWSLQLRVLSDLRLIVSYLFNQFRLLLLLLLFPQLLLLLSLLRLLRPRLARLLSLLLDLLSLLFDPLSLLLDLLSRLIDLLSLLLDLLSRLLDLLFLLLDLLPLPLLRLLDRLLRLLLRLLLLLLDLDLLLLLARRSLRASPPDSLAHSRLNPRPSNFLPSMASKASFASSSWMNLTNAYPRDRPEYLSVGMYTSLIVPYFLKSSSTLRSRVV